MCDFYLVFLITDGILSQRKIRQKARLPAARAG